MLSFILLLFNFKVIIGFILFYIIYYFHSKNKYLNKCLEKIPGPKARYPFLGNLDMFRIKGLPLNESTGRVLSGISLLYEKEGLFKIKLGTETHICVFRQQTIESLLKTNKSLDKSQLYLFKNWLGSNNLLVGTGTPWKNRRKLLTPAFHFKILDEFIPAINEQINIFIDILNKNLSNEFIDIRKLMVNLTLDIVCATTMGVSVGAQNNLNPEYLKAVDDMCAIFVKRVVSPWLRPDIIFYRTKLGKQFKANTEILHNMTRSVINKRKAEIMEMRDRNKINESEVKEETEENVYISNKSRNRKAFLDLLLEYHFENDSFSLEDVREEVDTIMFAGHDTTCVAITWILYMVGRHPEVKNNIRKELDFILGDRVDRDITAEDVKQMKYIECVIKETFRLFPPIPIYSRRLSEDLKVGDYVVPNGTTIYVLLEPLHRDPNVFPEPIKFKPERFENESTDIKAHQYLPFSAGPRNCIGQKYALNDLKVILSKILLNFEIESLDPMDKMVTGFEISNRAKTPIRVKFTPIKQI